MAYQQRTTKSGRVYWYDTEAAQQQVKKAYQNSRVPRSKAVTSTVNFRLGGGTGPEFTGGQNFTFGDGKPTNNHQVPATRPGVIDAEFERKPVKGNFLGKHGVNATLAVLTSGGDPVDAATNWAVIEAGDKLWNMGAKSALGQKVANSAVGRVASGVTETAGKALKNLVVAPIALTLYGKHKVDTGQIPHAEEESLARMKKEHEQDLKELQLAGASKEDIAFIAQQHKQAEDRYAKNITPSEYTKIHNARNAAIKSDLSKVRSDTLEQVKTLSRTTQANKAPKEQPEITSSSTTTETPMTTKVSSRSGTLYHEPASRVEGKTYYVDAERLDESTRNNIKNSKLYADSWKKDYAHRTDLSQEQKEIMNTADVMAMRKRANR